MEKKVCNLLHKATCKVYNDGCGELNYGLGYFTSLDVAKEAVAIFDKAIKETPNKVNMEVTASEYKKVWIPEDEMSGVVYYDDVYEFMATEPFVVKYLKQQNPKLYEQIKKLKKVPQEVEA